MLAMAIAMTKIMQEIVKTKIGQKFTGSFYSVDSIFIGDTIVVYMLHRLE